MDETPETPMGSGLVPFDLSSLEWLLPADGPGPVAEQIPAGYTAVDFGFYEGEAWESDRVGHFVPRGLWAAYEQKREELRELENEMRRYPYRKVANQRLIGY